MVDSLIVIAVLALVQSVFGVGLLVFGTPLLLLLGHPFREVLCLLLPASVTISALQVLLAEHRPAAQEWRDVVAWAVPALLLGLAARLTLDAVPRIDLALVALLLLTAALRHAVRPAAWLQAALAARQRLALSVIGLVHGWTNMGGVLLSMYAGVRHRDKVRTTLCIALGYLILASSQLLLLMLWREPVDPWPSLVTPWIAATAYLMVGRRAAGALRAPAFHLGFSAFMVACAMALLVRDLAVRMS